MKKKEYQLFKTWINRHPVRKINELYYMYLFKKNA